MGAGATDEGREAPHSRTLGGEGSLPLSNLSRSRGGGNKEVPATEGSYNPSVPQKS